MEKKSFKDSLLVVVPIYKDEISVEELVSVKRLCELIHPENIKLVCPDSLVVEKLPEILSNVRVERFADHYFESVSGYNKLMLEIDFYKRFINYKYILIYQLDCYLFSSRLDEFTTLDFDYIGAPWPRKNIYRLFAKVYPLDLRLGGICRLLLGKSTTVGNGGFSLRKVDAFIKVLKKLNWRLKSWKFNEDLFYSHCAPLYCKGFKVSDEKTAVKFGLDQEPKEFIDKYGLDKPLGCHGWNQYEKSVYSEATRFWKAHI